MSQSKLSQRIERLEKDNSCHIIFTFVFVIVGLLVIWALADNIIKVNDLKSQLGTWHEECINETINNFNCLCDKSEVKVGEIVYCYCDNYTIVAHPQINQTCKWVRGAE